eukprot:FR738702.1.p1 GENE.FR738702.1~~FR738702.1.p1  ORF type:complete len:160 (+),score=12.87 FR738702.1:90-569(+)
MSAAQDNSYGSEDPKLPDNAQTDSRIEQLIAMGFDSALASRALRRAHNNFDDALTMLTAGMVPEEDEFDVLAEEDAKGSGGGSTPAAKPVMVAETKKSDDTFSEGVEKGAPASAHIDSRISSLMAMGFTAEDVETALKLAKNDVDLALTILTTTDETSA